MNAKTRGSNRYRVPVRKYKNPKSRVGITNDTRVVTIGQLSILLWHLFKCANIDEAGYLDATQPINQFMNKNPMDLSVKMRKSDLERLLWAVNIGANAGFYWHPNEIPPKEFIEQFIANDEVFNYKWNLITDKKKRGIK